MKVFFCVCIIFILLLTTVSCNSGANTPEISPTPPATSSAQTTAEIPKETVTPDTATATPISMPERTPLNTDGLSIEEQNNIFWKWLAVEMNCTLPSTRVLYPISEYGTITIGDSYKEVVEKFGLPLYPPYSGRECSEFRTEEGYIVDIHIDINYNLETEQYEAYVEYIDIPDPAVQTLTYTATPEP